MFCVYCGNAISDTDRGPCPYCGKVPPGEEAPGLARDGKLLYVPLNAAFPDFCLKCNQPAEGFRRKVKLQWHPPSLRVLILIGVVPYAIVAAVLSKKATVYPPFCRKHRAAWSQMAWMGLVMLIMGIGGVIGMAFADDAARNYQGPIQVFMTLGFILLPIMLVAGVIMLVIGSKRVIPKKIDERGNAWLKGACREFLDQHVTATMEGP